MRALILAAGMGTRLRPYTNDRPKCMVEYRGRPVLDWIFTALHANDITEVAAVTGYCGDRIAKPKLRTYPNPRYQDTNMVHSLFCAEAELVDDVLISYSDIAYSPSTLAALLNSAPEAPIAILADKNWRKLWETRMEDPLADAETLKIDSRGDLVEIGKKPSSYDDIQGQYMGLIRISAAAWPAIRQFYKNLDRSAMYDGKSFDGMFMTSFLQLIVENVMPIKVVLTEAKWIEIDSPEDLRCDVDLW